MMTLKKNLNEANSGDGNTNQEDDIEKELAELEESTSDDEDFQTQLKRLLQRNR